MISLLVLFSFSMVSGAQTVREDSTTLLTVGELSNGERIGGTAHLTLSIGPGSGRVFIDSLPLTRLDTQITTRFAQRIACDYLDVDCSNVDFFYTIRAQTSLVGGPSAGAATTLLTLSLLSGNTLDENIGITGTINTGGLVGPVAGIPSKVNAAETAGLDKVFIPTWQMYNESEIDQDIDVELIEVSTLNDLIEQTNLGRSLILENSANEEPPEEYQNIMGAISFELCENALNLTDRVNDGNATENIDLAVNASANADYYSAASYCFGASTRLRSELYENQTNETRELLRANLLEKAEELETTVNNVDIQTMSDLEAVIIVKERLLEATEAINTAENLGFAEERLNSAFSWSKFLDYNATNSVNLDNTFLENACVTKLNELEERVNYLDFITGSVGQYRDDLSTIQTIATNEDYAFCIFRATRVKADVNSLLLLQTMDPDNTGKLAQTKLQISKNSVFGNENFPIIGYSYHDYAENLMQTNPELAVIFFEYASEFGNLDMYTGEGKSTFRFGLLEQVNRPSFFLGFAMTGIIGIILALSLGRKTRKISRKKGFKPRKISKRNPPRKKR